MPLSVNRTETLSRIFVGSSKSMFHFEFHRRLETLKRCYAPFNPDTDARRLRLYSEAEKARLHQELKTSLRGILDTVEEEEFKEDVLAYFFLSTAEGPLRRKDLDKRVEAWLESRGDCVVDFEVEDALTKLKRLGVIRRVDDRLSCLDLERAMPALDAIRDGYFPSGPWGEANPPR
jgi:hypothetical protein